MYVKPELAHRSQTSKMSRNSTSLNTCEYDVNTVTVCNSAVKAKETVCRAFYTLVEHITPTGDYFTIKGHYFAP